VIELKRAQDLRISVVNNEIIQCYMKDIAGGFKVDPVQIRPGDPLYRVIDGNHRAAAYKKLGMLIPTIPE
jgi:hypothetical protein